MNRLRILALVTVLALVAVSVAGCFIVEGEDDATITCDSFDGYLASCYPECGATWDCEHYYDGLDYDTQLWLDDCSDCLDANRYSCSDCVVDGYSCYDMLASYLGISCAW